MAIDKSHPKYQELLKVSNPSKVIIKKNAYLGKNIEIFISDRKDKKYMVLTPEGKRVHFGNINFEDYSHHNNESRRDNYLKRASSIKGNWKADKYSANNLSLNILWG